MMESNSDINKPVLRKPLFIISRHMERNEKAKYLELIKTNEKCVNELESITLMGATKDLFKTKINLLPDNTTSMERRVHQILKDSGCLSIEKTPKSEDLGKYLIIFYRFNRDKVINKTLKILEFLFNSNHQEMNNCHNKFGIKPNIPGYYINSKTNNSHLFEKVQRSQPSTFTQHVPTTINTSSKPYTPIRYPSNKSYASAINHLSPRLKITPVIQSQSNNSVTSKDTEVSAITTKTNLSAETVQTMIDLALDGMKIQAQEDRKKDLEEREKLNKELKESESRRDQVLRDHLKRQEEAQKAKEEKEKSEKEAKEAAEAKEKAERTARDDKMFEMLRSLMRSNNTQNQPSNHQQSANTINDNHSIPPSTIAASSSSPINCSALTETTENTNDLVEISGQKRKSHSTSTSTTEDELNSQSNKYQIRDANESNNLIDNNNMNYETTKDNQGSDDISDSSIRAMGNDSKLQNDDSKLQDDDDNMNFDDDDPKRNSNRC